MTETAIQVPKSIMAYKTDSFPQFFREHLIGAKKFTVGWTKKGGDFRVGTFDLKFRKRYKTAEGIWKKCKGKRKLNDWAFSTYCTAFDLDKKDYRMITYDTIEYIEIGRAKFTVDVERKNETRIFTMKSLDKIKSN